MVKQGTVLNNKITGERIEFLETNESTGGRMAKIKWNTKPGGFKPAMHIHLLQDERFEIISGYYGYEINGKTGRLGPGEAMDFPKAVPHTHYHTGEGDAEFIQIVTPALEFEDILYRLNELHEQGKLNNGEPPLLEVMVWLRKYQAKTYLAKIPIGVQNALAFLLAPIGRLLGHGGS